MKCFRPPNFFKLFEQFQKLVAFLLPIFRNVDGSWRVTSKLRGSTLLQVARRRSSKVFQRFSASLVRVGDVQGVSRRHAVRGGLKKWKNLFFAFFIIFYISTPPKSTQCVLFFTSHGMSSRHTLNISNSYQTC